MASIQSSYSKEEYHPDEMKDSVIITPDSSEEVTKHSVLFVHDFIPLLKTKCFVSLNTYSIYGEGV